MAITITATWGGTASNSYALISEAHTYVAGYKLSSEQTVWRQAEDDDISIALLRATENIDNSFSYVGTRREINQNLQFPRRFPMYDYPYITADPLIQGEDEVQRFMEDRVKKACIEQAFYIIKNQTSSPAERHQQRQNYGIRGWSESLGPIGESYSYGTPGDFIELVPDSYRYIQYYIVSARLTRGGAFDSSIR